MMRGAKKSLLVFGFHRLEHMVAKGNLNYAKNYGLYFDEVVFAYLLGNKPETISEGAVRFISAGTGQRWLDLFSAPFALFSLIRRYRPDVVLTADMVFAGYITVLCRRLLGTRVALVPTCIPEQLYKDSGKTLSGMPVWLERRLIAWSFASAHTVYTGRAFGNFVDWLQGDPAAASKLLCTDSLPEALPSPGFLDALASLGATKGRNDRFTMIYVGRLHHEKLVDDLLFMVRHLIDEGVSGASLRLRLIGDGPQRGDLEALAAKLDILDVVEFCGSVRNEDLPPRLAAADVFVSPLTGSSLREAALCGIPIVAYDRDWIHGLLEDESTALLVNSRDYKAMAKAVRRLMENDELRTTLAARVRDLAERLWSPASIPESLEALHNSVQPDRATCSGRGH